MLRQPAYSPARKCRIARPDPDISLTRISLTRISLQAKARPLAKSFGEYARKHPQQDRAIAAAYASGGCTIQDTGDYFGLHYSRVSKIVRAGSQYRSRAEGKDLTSDP